MKKYIYLIAILQMSPFCLAEPINNDLDSPSFSDSFKDLNVKSPFDDMNKTKQLPIVIKMPEEKKEIKNDNKNPGELNYINGNPVFSNKMTTEIIINHSGPPIENELIITSEFLDSSMGSINHIFPLNYQENILCEKISLININIPNDNIMTIYMNMEPNNEKGQNLDVKGEFSYSAPIIKENNKYFLDVSNSQIDVSSIHQTDGNVLSNDRIENMKINIQYLLSKKLNKIILYSN